MYILHLQDSRIDKVNRSKNCPGMYSASNLDMPLLSFYGCIAIV